MKCYCRYDCNPTYFSKIPTLVTLSSGFLSLRTYQNFTGDDRGSLNCKCFLSFCGRFQNRDISNWIKTQTKCITWENWNPLYLCISRASTEKDVHIHIIFRGSFFGRVFRLKKLRLQLIVFTCRVAEVGSQKTFVRREFAFFATNASFCKVANLV